MKKVNLIKEIENLSLTEKIVMAVMIPIFAIVAGTEHLIAKITGSTYNEVNIVIYYLLTPLSWAIMADYITKMPFLTPIYLLAWILFLWKDPMKFRIVLPNPKPVTLCC